VKNFKKMILILVGVLFLVVVYMNNNNVKEDVKLVKKPIIVLSTFALFDIATKIAGDTLELVKILPFGVDAHSFEPTPKLMAKIDSSQLVIYSGAGLEPWIDGFNFKSKTLDMSKFVSLRKLDGHHHSNHKHTNHKMIDPHYWLDLDNMKKMANKMTDEFIAIEPKNKSLYEKNRDLYLSMLTKLDSNYKAKLSSCLKDTIIVNHNAFSYIADRYNFHVESLSGFIPEAEASPKDMIRVIENIKEHNISIIFFESFVSAKPIQSVANEMNVSVGILQPIGNITADEAKKNLGYKEIMKNNLIQFSKALECQ